MTEKANSSNVFTNNPAGLEQQNLQPQANPPSGATIEVVDYATGAKGSYCIQRYMVDNPAFVEFWNPSPNKWAGSGYVFTDVKLAHAICGLLSNSKPRCVDCNSAGISNCSHFDNCAGRWVYAQRA